MGEEIEEHDSISFKVDAGLIERLGRELVGRSETAVSELIKNAYDADAISVDVKFINSNEPGGTLKIIDTGLGMTRSQLEDGFMTISSTDKIHNPKSERFKRKKAGRKGIGRFATQRLGKKLTIITQTKKAAKALKLTIEWDNYKIDTDLLTIKNPVKEIEKSQEEGTVLIIDQLRESWSEAEIRRIYSYVSDLLQPDYLSDRGKALKLARQIDESFKVKFTTEIDGVEKVIADPDKMIYEKALAVIEGWIDKTHDGFCSVESSNLNLDIDSNIIEILRNKKVVIEEKVGDKLIKKEKTEPKFKHLKNVHFKAYYFIYQREDYYTNITKSELKNIEKLAQEQGGIKVYRNGFRVLPYGEQNNDWLSLDKNSNFRSGVANIPFANKNLFGFVEIVDDEVIEEGLFEETASREGLLQNDSYEELQDFVSKALRAGMGRLRAGVNSIRKKIESPIQTTDDSFLKNKTTIEKLDELEENINNIIDGKGTESQQLEYKSNVQLYVRELRIDIKRLLDELGMTRVLAGLGLTIGEFTHEVIQFSPAIFGDLSVLSEQKLNEEGLNSLENLKRTIKLFTSYTSYFSATVSANVSRELKPQILDVVINRFRDVVQADMKKSGIEFSFDAYGYDLITIPMHSSEWSSILFNLYTNSKKAIKRADVEGRIKIIVGKENGKVYIEFKDNGDGIPDSNKDRIFDAFFTTSTPAGFEAPQDERLTGTGLGLKIVRDIVQSYGGTIEVVKPDIDYVTSFRLEIPAASQKQREEYGL